MKPFDKVMKDIKEILNYQGPVFMKTPNEPPLFTVEERFCPKCGETTRHEYVRDLDTNYWRCEDCLQREIRTPPFYIYTPPHIQNPRTLDIDGVGYSK